MTTTPAKPKLASCWLGGCAGCHMSLLDIDERILDLAKLVEFTATPITDTKVPPEVDIALIEGAVCNEENVHTLKLFRARAKFLIALGDCAVFGNLPAMRNMFTIQECLEEAFVDTVSTVNGKIPNGPDLPKLLPKVLPVPQVVKVDYCIPGCPPDAEIIWFVLTNLLQGKVPAPTDIPYEHFKFD
ncbi:MAG: NADP oxidoreductase [bacterium]|nr:NADP oxidoreductase [bacterium]